MIAIVRGILASLHLYLHHWPPPATYLGPARMAQGFPLLEHRAPLGEVCRHVLNCEELGWGEFRQPKMIIEPSEIAV